MHGKGMVFRGLNLTHLLDEHVECLTDISTQTQGSAVLCLIPTVYASGRVVQPCRTPPHGIVTISDLGEVGCEDSSSRAALDSLANVGAGTK